MMFVIGLLLSVVSYMIFERVRTGALPLVWIFIAATGLTLAGGKNLQFALAEGLLVSGGWLVGTGILIFVHKVGILQALEKRKRSEDEDLNSVEATIVLADDGELPKEDPRVRRWFVEFNDER